jgi:hypothetical protein
LARRVLLRYLLLDGLWLLLLELMLLLLLLLLLDNNW